MFADMPWFNNVFASSLADPRDASPAPYLLFYTSLNVASTFLLPILFMLLCFIVLKIIACSHKDKIETLQNISWVIYNYFLGGLSFATAACIQGALLNPMDNWITVSSAFYLLGICLFVVLLGEAIWSSAKDSHNLFKIRTIAKSVLLSVLHYNALYLFVIILGF